MKAREGECKTVKSNQRTLCKRGVIRACDLPVEVEAEVDCTAVDIPTYVYFGTFDGHAGSGCAVAAAGNELHVVLHREADSGRQEMPRKRKRKGFGISKFRYRNKHEKTLREGIKSSESASDDGTESSSSSSSSSPAPPGPAGPRRAKRPRREVLSPSSGSEQSVNDEISHDLADAVRTQASTSPTEV